MTDTKIDNHHNNYSNLTFSVLETLEKMRFPKELNNILGPDAVLSGSFAWYILTANADAKWLPQDLDIFCTRPALLRIRKFLIENGFEYGGIDLKEYMEDSGVLVEQWTKGEYPDRNHNYEWWSTKEELRLFLAGVYDKYHVSSSGVLFEDDSRVLSGTELKKFTGGGGLSVQLIIDPVQRFPETDASYLIKGRFDFPTLENWWNGELMSISYPERVSQRVSVVRHYKYKSPAYKKRHVFDRIKKYEKYGLNIKSSNDDHFVDSDELKNLILKSDVNQETKISVVRMSDAKNFPLRDVEDVGIRNDMRTRVRFTKSVPNAVTPTKGTSFSVGYDLTCITEVFPEFDLPENVRMFDTGLIVEPPQGYYTEIIPRSSLIKSGHMLANSIGIIDPDYRGSLKIAIAKISEHADDLEPPFRMFQLVLRKYEDYVLVEVEDRNLSGTIRAAGGFGSTDTINSNNVEDSKRSGSLERHVPISEVRRTVCDAPRSSAEHCCGVASATDDTVTNTS